MTTARNFFTDPEKEKIVEAIRQSESITSGEIRVHLEESCGADVMQRAISLFQKFNMQTALHNGVLIYLAVKDHMFAIIADKAINERVPPNFWDSIKETMQSYFVEGRFLEGLLYGIRETGSQLRVHFPVAANDGNELSDEISFND